MTRTEAGDPIDKSMIFLQHKSQAYTVSNIIRGVLRLARFSHPLHRENSDCDVRRSGHPTPPIGSKNRERCVKEMAAALEIETP